MTTVSIIGTGSMGSALAELFQRSGAHVQPIAHSEISGPINGEIVLLAVPYQALAEIVAAAGDRLLGKIVVDLTNPLDPATFGPLEPAAGSVAAELAQTLPASRILKAFNTTFATNVASGRTGEQPLTVLVAGDDEDAKAQLLALLESAGTSAVNAGPLVRARQLEAFGYLQMALAMTGGISFTGGFAVAK
jgi:predicted dinucleotide-binding enzyme